MKIKQKKTKSKNPIYTWYGLYTIGGRNGIHFSISFLGKCVEGWKDYYGEQKPWQHLGYSNPIFAISKNWGYDEKLNRYRVVFCLLWFNIQW